MNDVRVSSSLNGAWSLVLDPEDIGKQKRWFMPKAQGLPASIEVQVPSVWDRWVPDYDGVGWYFREFDYESAWHGKRVFVEFEAADYVAEVWVNGGQVGEHEGGYTPFAFEITEDLKEGTNFIAVRIIDPHGEQGFQKYGYREFPSAKETGYWTFGGIWGAVTICAKNPSHITDVFVQPDIRRKRIAVEVASTGGQEVRLTVEGTPYGATGPVGALRVEMEEFELWSPSSPTLYTLRCELIESGEVVDVTTVRFGMREFTIKENRFYLNNHPILLKGVLHQPDYARTLVAPESPELARRELELAKAAGFNLIRLHIKTAPKITVELCDEIGLLVYAEPPIGWIKKSEYMQERCEREVRELILRDRNNPSVVIWGMLNETGNAKYVTHGGAQDIKDGLCKLARSLDPSRVIIDDSGGVNATREVARFMRPYHDELEPYDDLHIYQRAPVDRDIEGYFRHSGDPEGLVFLSEFGFGGMEDLPDVIAQYGEDAEGLKDAKFLQHMLEAARQGYAERELDRIFGDFSKFTAAARELQCDAARYQVDAIRANVKYAGYCYTQLCDAGHEFCAGVLDRWRRAKPVFETLKHVQKSLRPLIHAARYNLVPREEIDVKVMLANDDRLEAMVDVSLQVVGPTNQVLWKKKRSMKLPRHGKELWTGTISASGSPGTHKFVVRISQANKIIAENSADFYVFEAAAPCDVPVHVIDPLDEWKPRCLPLVREGDWKAPVFIVPPLANTIRAYPDRELAQVMSAVRGGAVAIFFAPPEDWNDFADRIDADLCATAKDAAGSFLGMYHYVKLHPVFEGLPSRGLMRQQYRAVIAPKTFIETSDEDICGTFDTGPIAAGHYMMGETKWWGSDILVRRYGSGRIVLTHMRILENLGEDPVANRLFVNMLRHFSRWAVPSEEISPVQQAAEDWLRRERVENTRMWLTLGLFPNWGKKGHDAAYPPESKIEPGAVYPGWYKPITWRRWHSRAKDDHLVDLQWAFSPVYQYYPRFDWGTGYAYAEFTTDQRQDATMTLGLQDYCKVWFNGRLVHESRTHIPHTELEHYSVPVFIKQGKNTVLVKISKIPGEIRFKLAFESNGKTPLSLKWWK